MAIAIGLVTTKLDISNQLQILYILPAFFAVLQSYLQTRVYIHESPKYLVQKGLMKECEEALAGIYSSFEAINNELTSLLRQRNRPPVSYKLLFGKIYSTQLFVGCTLCMIQQLSGINLINVYGYQLLKGGAIGESSDLLLGALNFASSFVCFAFVDSMLFVFVSNAIRHTEKNA